MPLLTLVVAVVALLAAAHPAAAQTATAIRSAPFYPGESMEYSVGYGRLPAGTLEIGIDELDTLDGRPAYHIVFKAASNQAISFLYDINSREESWFDAREFYSLRYRRESTENDETRTKEYVFDQQRQVRIEPDGDVEPASPRAVDQVAMFYYVRLLPLEPGSKFVLRNQADPDDNPLTIEVLKKERVKVPAGTFDAYVLDLDVRTDGGLFKKGGENRIWVTTDARHVPVKISSKVGLGSFEAELVDYTRGAPVTSAR
ncbi:MAG TPA: DUF3108 domain-containing protein [Gemmatimonadota bacterium]|nr:DUF3108 domain-containing protein [Gemmatimonadota bacterium]